MSYNNPHDFFKKFNNLFEGKDPDDSYDEKRQEKVDAESDAEDAKKKKEEPKKPANVKENAADFFRKYSDIIKEAEGSDKEWNVVSGDDQVVRGPYKDEMSAHDALAKLKKSAEGDDECSGYKVKASKKGVNESWNDDDEEDPDVAKADKVKGKDGKTQKDSEKKLPPWLKKNLDKADKKAEDKGAKKTKKEKDLDEGVFGAQWNDKEDGWEQPKTPAVRKNVADKLRAARKVGDNPRVDGGERGKAGDVTTVSVPANSNRQGRNTTGDFMPNNVRTGKVPPKGPNGRTRA